MNSIKIISSIFVLTLILSGCASKDKEPVSTNASSPVTQIGSETAADNTTPATSETGNIIVNTPTADSTAASPIEITGTAKVWGKTVNVDIVNSKGDVMISEIANVHANAIGEFGPFRVGINYAFQATKEGAIRVYSTNPQTGGPEHLVEIPVKFQTPE